MLLSVSVLIARRFLKHNVQYISLGAQCFCSVKLGLPLALVSWETRASDGRFKHIWAMFWQSLLHMVPPLNMFSLDILQRAPMIHLPLCLYMGTYFSSLTVMSAYIFGSSVVVVIVEKAST
jgi:hypothetical protein